MTVLARPNTENISVISYYEREFSTFERDDIGYASYTKMPQTIGEIESVPPKWYW